MGLGFAARRIFAPLGKHNKRLGIPGFPFCLTIEAMINQL